MQHGWTGRAGFLCLGVGLSLRAQRGNLNAVAMMIHRRVLNLTGIATSLTLLAMTGVADDALTGSG